MEGSLKWRLNEGDELELVVVQAETAGDAMVDSGLIFESFREATEAEAEQWDALTAEPLTEADVESMLSILRVEQRQTGKSRARARTKGRLGLVARDGYKARKLALLRGKLEVMETDGAAVGEERS
jgi:hypothetical protein